MKIAEPLILYAFRKENARILAELNVTSKRNENSFFRPSREW
jgi:hypothetical protein